MSYVLKRISSGFWGQVVLPSLPQDLKEFVARLHWQEVAVEGGVAVDEKTCNWICSAPPLVTGSPNRWYFFCFEGEVFCFSICSPSKPHVNFYKNNPSKEYYENFGNELRLAFDAYGFYGLPDEELIRIKPMLPEIEGGAA